WFFSAVGYGNSVTLLVKIYCTSERNKLSNIAYALIIGVAIGNLLDRLRYGMVVDYIDFYGGDWHWPTFNLADRWNIIGEGVIIIGSFNPDGKKSGKPER
ncbi:signal peptidase II, partial [Morganella morganii]|uniref:signal peptidase II n=1 Tax=Morganella morganii TaxID=582 RepID=UPI0015F37BC3